ATVTNLGGVPSTAAVLRAVEGELASGIPMGGGTIAALAPGEAVTLELSWTPASPPGERTLALLADAEETVAEQNEGNNLARRTVVVQDADLFLTAPFFSPDGDGIQDDTTLAYRATGSVTVVVSNARGQRVRTLATDGPAADSLVWDGRDDHGALLPDGSYAISLIGDGGVLLGRASAEIDTNRSPIHDAAGTDLVATRDMTCAKPIMQ